MEMFFFDYFDLLEFQMLIISILQIKYFWPFCSSS